MTAPASSRVTSLLLHDLKDLKLIQRELAARHQREQALLAQRAAELARAKAERELFARSVGSVVALPAQHQAALAASLLRPRPAPIAVQHLRDEQAVMHEALSDGFDVETLLDTDETLSFKRPGLGPDVVRKLRRGNWQIQQHIDLHGLRREEARDALGAFIRHAHHIGLRCVRVVHGKGMGSEGKVPVLKGRVHSWLVQKKEVLAFVQARPAHGGAGALVVLLVPWQPHKRY